MSQYSFPLLSTSEIVSCLAEFDLPLEEAQLAKPTHDAMRAVYESVVHVLVEVSREELLQPVFSAIDALEFPELHDESIPAMSLLHHLTRLMTSAGVKDFGLKDLYKPDPTRTRRNLSAIINFAKFREEKLVPYTQLQEEIEAALEERERLEAVNLQMTNELKRLQAERAEEQPEVDKLEEELTRHASKVQELNVKQSDMQAEVRTLKQASNELADKQAELKFALLSERQQADKLAEQIVQSPEKLQKSLESMQQAVERERHAGAVAEKQSRELRSRIDGTTRMEKEVLKTVAMMDGVKQAIDQKKQVSREVKDAKAVMTQSENEAQHLATTTQHHRRQHAALVERIARIEAQAKLKHEAAACSVEERVRDKEALEAERLAAEAKVSENEAMVRSLKQQTGSLRATHEGQVGSVMEQYGRLLADVTNYNQQLVDAMQGQAGER
eukprot:jgi/Tetstr1/444590/TSEL_032440.t1